jgi:hypothetical protein
MLVAGSRLAMGDGLVEAPSSLVVGSIYNIKTNTIDYSYGGCVILLYSDSLTSSKFGMSCLHDPRISLETRVILSAFSRAPVCRIGQWTDAQEAHPQSGQEGNRKRRDPSINA